MLTEIQLDSMNILILVALVLGLPLLVGMMTGKLFPRFAARAEKPMRVITLLVLLLFVGVAFGNNMDVFLATADRIVILVVLQNLLALGMGAFAEDAREEILQLFPELREDVSAYSEPVRPTLKVREARVLAENPELIKE